jgi:hypothetical protein
MGRAMLQISLVFAELERARLTESFEVARERAVRNGVHIASRVVLGYRRRPNRVLEPDPETRQLIPELFERRAAGESWASLGEWLDEVAPRPSGGRWVGPTVAAMVRNRVYLGEARHGDYVKTGAHEALVTRAAFEAAQGAKRRAPRRSGSLLAGLLVCASCGRPMTHGWAGKHVKVYRCQGRSSAGRCSRPMLVTSRAADEYVDTAYLYVLEQTGILTTTASPSGASTAKTDELTAELESAELELAEYRDANLVSVIGRDAYVAGLGERAARVDAARRVLVEAQTATAWERDVPTREAWAALGMREKRALLDARVEAIIVMPTTRGSRKHVSRRMRWVWKRPEEMQGVELVTEHELGDEA